MKLAVLVPYREPSAELDLALQGILAQGESGWDLELVLVHNGDSECDTTLAAEMPFPVHHRCIGHQKPPYSLASARNAGLRSTRATWVLCLDADCVPAPGHFASLARELGRVADGNLIIAGERRFVDVRAAGMGAELFHQLAELPPVPSRSNHGRSIDVRFPYLRNPADAPHPWDLMHGGNIAFRRDVAVAVGGFDEKFDGHWGFEDAEFAYRMIRRGGATPAFARDAIVYHQESGEDIASRDRSSRHTNPNWHRVCALIPGFEEFKSVRRREIYGHES